MNDVAETTAPDADAQAAATPAATSERIAAIDVLRGVAVLGILLINIEDFGLLHAEKSAPGTEWVGAYLPDLGQVELVLWTLGRALFEGKMRAVFSILFGSGVVLLTSRLERGGRAARSADIYYRRTLWLLVIGMLHAYLLWEGDILYSYALSGLFLFPFRNLSARSLIAAGLFMLALSVPRASLVALDRESLRTQAAQASAEEATGHSLSERQEEALDEWANIAHEFEPDAAALEEKRQAYREGYFRLLARRAPLVMIAESHDYYGWAFFDSVGMMLIGMGLLKSGVVTAERSRRFYGMMALVGFAVGLPVNVALAYALYLRRFDPVAVAWWTTAYHPARLVMAMAHIALVMLFVKSGWAGGIAKALGFAGRMALTNYLATTLICTTLFNGYGFGLFGMLARHQLYYVVIAVWCCELAFSRLWLSTFRFGPTEWAWRSLTYWKVQPLKVRRAEQVVRA